MVFLLITRTFVVIIAEYDLLLTVIITILKFQFPELDGFAHVLEAALVVGDSCFPEVVEFVVVLKTDDVLVVGHALLQEDEFLLGVLSLGPLGRSGHIFEHPPGDVDVVLDFVGDGVDDGFLGLHLRRLSLGLLQVAELVHHVDHLRKQLGLDLLAFVEPGQRHACVQCVGVPDYRLYFLVPYVHE